MEQIWFEELLETARELAQKSKTIQLRVFDYAGHSYKQKQVAMQKTARQI